MEGRRRTIEVDEDVAVALEKRAAEEDMSVSDMLAAEYLAPREVEISAEDLAELEERGREWERDRLGVPAEEVAQWLKSWGTANELPPPRPRRL